MPYKIDNFAHQPHTIPDATGSSDGVMTAAQSRSLTALGSGRPVIASTRKTLPSDGSAVSLIVVDMTKVPDNSFASTINFGAEVTDNVNVQIRSGNINANVAKASNGTYATSQAQNSTLATTGGPMTVTFSWVTTPTTATLQVALTTGLVVTEAHIDFYIPFATHPAAVVVA